MVAATTNEAFQRGNTMLTLITMYRGFDAEIFTQVVEGRLTPEQRSNWRKAFQCDEHYNGPEDDENAMWFREFETILPNHAIADMLNASGDMTILQGGENDVYADVTEDEPESLAEALNREKCSCGFDEGVFWLLDDNGKEPTSVGGYFILHTNRGIDFCTVGVRGYYTVRGVKDDRIDAATYANGKWVSTTF